MEIWKPVVGYEGKYEASSAKRIRRIYKSHKKVLLAKNGVVTLWNDSHWRSAKVLDVYNAAHFGHRASYMAKPAIKINRSNSAPSNKPAGLSPSLANRRLTYSKDDYDEVIEEDGTIRLIPKNQTWEVLSTGEIERVKDGDISKDNVFPNANQASYAGAQIRRTMKLIKACLLVQPNFRADFTTRQDKWQVYFSVNYMKWLYHSKANSTGYSVGVVGSEKAAKTVCDMLNSKI